jgi:hypothetical protein
MALAAMGAIGHHAVDGDQEDDDDAPDGEIAQIHASEP